MRPIYFQATKGARLLYPGMRSRLFTAPQSRALGFFTTTSPIPVWIMPAPHHQSVTPPPLANHHSVYRIHGPDRHKAMTLAAAEFIRRFLMHVLPSGFHRIRNYVSVASRSRDFACELSFGHLSAI
jgi:hypothetical protein